MDSIDGMDGTRLSHKSDDSFVVVTYQSTILSLNKYCVL